MPATYCSLHYHAVFSTKDRYPLITRDWRDNLHAYLGGIVKNLGGVPLAIGGIEDHAHVLMGLRATHAVANVMRELKSGSSDWAHTTVGKRSFSWQPDYFGVTVSPSTLRESKGTFLIKRTIIGTRASKKNISRCSNSRGLNMTNDMCGEILRALLGRARFMGR